MTVNNCQDLPQFNFLVLSLVTSMFLVWPSSLFLPVVPSANLCSLKSYPAFNAFMYDCILNEAFILPLPTESIAFSAQLKVLSPIPQLNTLFLSLPLIFKPYSVLSSYLHVLSLPCNNRIYMNDHFCQGRKFELI